jgi:hypothetical protein
MTRAMISQLPALVGLVLGLGIVAALLALISDVVSFGV